MNWGFFFFHLDSARITNLAIDQQIAGTRDVHQTYPSKFFYYHHTDIKEDSEANYKKYLQEIETTGFSSSPITFELFDQQVYSALPNVDMSKLQAEAGYTDEAKTNAAKVASVLAKDSITNGATLGNIEIDLEFKSGSA